MIRAAHIARNPFVAGGIAVIVVLLIAAFGASHVTVTPAVSSGEVERVAVSKNIFVAPQPRLALNVAQSGTAAPAPAAATSIDTPQIARTAKVSIYVDNVDKASSAVARIALADNGDVFSSDVSNGDESVTQATGQMEIRVPADRFDTALERIARIGKVRERSTSAEDLTSDITDSDARLRNLRQTEDDIRHIMDRSGSVAQIMDAESRLSEVREQIETLEAQLKSMRGRVTYATIDVDLQAEAVSTPVQPTPSSQLTSAWRSAVAAVAQTTIGLVSAVLWLIVFIPYLLVVAGLAWLLARPVLYRRRGAQ